MTTGDPDAPAAVTNRGTAQNAILDFVIPQGSPGGSSTPQALLNAYSTPPQPGASGSQLVFDQNSAIYGCGITHTAGSSIFSLAEPGFYLVSYHSAVAPAAGGMFPASLSLALHMGGAPVPGMVTRHVFQCPSEVRTLAASQVLQVTGPTKLTLVGSGGSFQYSDLGMSICKLGEG